MTEHARHVLVLSLFVALALLGPSSLSAAAPALGRGDRPASAAFRWLVPRPAPPSWPQLDTPPTGATLSYPPSFAAEPGDPGSVSAALRTPTGVDAAYLNATPQQGAERPRGFATFRVRLLSEDHGEAVREEAAAEGLAFRGGHGSCVVDSYATRIGHRRYREIACLVVGAHASTVVVAAALTTRWNRFRSVLQRSVAAFMVR